MNVAVIFPNQEKEVLYWPLPALRGYKVHSFCVFLFLSLTFYFFVQLLFLCVARTSAETVLMHTKIGHNNIATNFRLLICRNLLHLRMGITLGTFRGKVLDFCFPVPLLFILLLLLLLISWPIYPRMERSSHFCFSFSLLIALPCHFILFFARLLTPY